MPLNPIASGIDRTFRGLRTGDQRSMFTGALLLAFGLWQRGRRDQRKLIHREVLKPGHAVVIRANTVSGERILVTNEFAEQVTARKSRRSRANT
jgi:hypothetical protein